MVEIDGTNCKAVDGTKNVVDGLIKIAQRSVEVNHRKGIEETEAKKISPSKKTAEQSKRIVEMLQSCGQVNSKFEDYAKKILKQWYNTDFKVVSSKPKSPNQDLHGAN
ncbi:MAG: hypothetical protein ACXWRE_09875 [Pseudobdellovibrionaceae bacterium]